jgi:DNA repair exonuclease SbcCD ATPase subunit
LCAAVAALLLIPANALAQQQNQDQQGQRSGPTSQQASSQTAAQSSSPSAAPAQTAPVDPLVAAARKAREQKKDQPKPARVFDNDNIPTQGGVSAVGSTPGGESTEGGAAAEPSGDQAAGKTAAPPSGNDEKAWRERFTRLRKKLEQDQADLEIMQRELGVLDVQYYNDPMKGMQQGYTRSDINEKTAKIDEKTKQIEADQQALSDAEDELRRSGGDIGWAR